MRVFSPPSQDDLLLAFKRFDKNGDGFLTPDEVKEVLRDANQPATDRNVTEMIESVDSNGDGKINYKGVFLNTCNYLLCTRIYLMFVVRRWYTLRQ